jgi:glycine/D-amino acid oxidase-like deaminating enzyme
VTLKYQIIVCGAGITGVSAAYYLAAAGLKDILLVDERPPLTLTSDRSTECYRNWWPDPEILALMNRSIDLMEQLSDESGNTFHMNRRGYLYVTGDTRKIPTMKESALCISARGGGPLRIHNTSDSGYVPQPLPGGSGEPLGADLLIGNQIIRTHFPYLTDSAAAALHVRRAGWLSAQQLGMYLLEKARKLGVTFARRRVDAVAVSNGQVRGITLSDGERIDCQIFVNAAGPYFRRVGTLLGLEIPVHTEVHLKVTFRDHLGVVPREAPLLIWDDPQSLPWEEDELALLRSDPALQWLSEPFPAGAHTRPEGTGESQAILMLWDYKTGLMEPVFPPPLDEQYPEVVLRGLSTMLPGLRAYFGRGARPQIDGGYYVKTRENRLFAGPSPVEGAYVIGAVSGYGIMSACGAGELLAAHVAGTQLPAYAGAFALGRYEDPEYRRDLEQWGERGEL